MREGVTVRVLVGDGVCVAVADFVGVFVEVGVRVLLGVAVTVAVPVGVRVGVLVGVAVEERVGVGEGKLKARWPTQVPQRFSNSSAYSPWTQKVSSVGSRATLL